MRLVWHHRGVKFMWDMDSSAGWYGCCEGRQEP